MNLVGHYHDECGNGYGWSAGGKVKSSKYENDIWNIPNLSINMQLKWKMYIHK